MAIREGLWDCQYCGAQGIPGREKVCPNCARSRPEGTKFYLPEDRAAAPVITDEKLIQQAKAGADWICEYCSSSNPAELTVCRHCGAAREASSPQQEVVNYALEAAPTSGDMDLDAPAPAPAPARSSGRKGPAWLPIAVVGVVVLLLVLCGFFVFRTTEQRTSDGTRRSVEVCVGITVAFGDHRNAILIHTCKPGIGDPGPSERERHF